MSQFELDLTDADRSATWLDGDWWPAPLPPNVEVGERCYLYSSFAFQRYRSRRPVGVRIGDDTGVYEGSVFDLGPAGEVRIGRFSTVVSPVFLTNGRVEIGDFAFISHDVVIADDAIAVPPDAVAGVGRDPEQESPAIVLGEDVWVGTKAVLLAGTQLGDGAIVGAGAVVDRPVPPYAIVAGNPARLVGYARPGLDRDPTIELPEVHVDRLVRAGRAPRRAH
jgi:acetyltransferase-like isoleucine patch superfamily enzyme